jgi:hypothetical protein
MVYFENTDAERSIPRGLSMLVVDEKASADLKRREFFCQLGVEVCNRNKICKNIQFLHNERLPENPEGSPFDLETCIAHAVYLFRSGYPHDDDDTFYVYDTNEKLIDDTKVYIPFDEDGEKVNQLFPSGSDEIHRLHQAYQSAVPEVSLERWWSGSSLGAISKYGRSCTTVANSLNLWNSYYKFRHLMAFFCVFDIAFSWMEALPTVLRLKKRL